ncbi:beta-ketoacyl-[acyl-carrier-protein] synthase family protein [Gulosibacter hominis]|uniref:beta-ketoacyl-[acyl-carrier-protein] synthase family protein n=1 Tax=Gulosibacter hominis TaxID=2770504 RepID=UPI0019197199|nr:beta-ketoacyl-[acyl-carrier-protein] synthase family protein [Gulosibacter hominis]
MRVAVTGYGLITAAGENAEANWDAFINARTGIGENTIVPREGVMSDRAGQFRPMTETDARHDRAVRLGEAAIGEALERAGLGEDAYPRERIGLSLGTSLGGARQGEKFHRDWIERGLDATNRFDLIEYPLHATADALAAKFALHGPRTIHSNACAAGAVAIANGYEYLLDGQADVVVAGGVDPLAWISFGGFSSLGVLTSMNCAPYTRSDGITLGEGSGILILENYDRAVARGATIYAELLGYGLTADAYHPTAPDPRGRGALAAVDHALRMADLERDDIDYINGHGTGTPANDTGELKTVLEFRGGQLPMSSTKSMTGHTLGAAGAVEAAVSVMTIEHQRIHPTFVPGDEVAQEKLRERLEAGEVNIVPDQFIDQDVDYVLSNSFAFGGNNASLVFGRPDAKPVTADAAEGRRARTDVQISATSALVAGATNEAAVIEALGSGTNLVTEQAEIDPGVEFPVGRCADKALTAGLNRSAMRRVDHLGKLGVQAVQQLLKQRPLSGAERGTTGLIFATATGPLGTVEAFQRGLIVDGKGDSKLFPNTVMNAAAGHVAVTFGLRGPTATFCAGGASGVSALHLALQLLRNRQCDRVIVAAADEVADALLAGYSRFPGYLATSVAEQQAGKGTVYSEGAVALLLEARDALADDEPRTGAYISGIGLSGAALGAGRVSRTPQEWARSYRAALEQAGITATDIDAVVLAEAGVERIDRVERAALDEIGIDAQVPRISPQLTTGNLQTTGTLLAVPIANALAAGAAVSTDTVPPTADRPLQVLVSGVSVGGSYQAYVVTVDPERESANQ